MKVRVTFEEEVLGTGCANPEVHEEFIAGKSADAKKVKEELESMPAEDILMDKAMTVFARTTDGQPMLWDYQIKGFLKESLGILLDFYEDDTKIGKAKLSRWTYKKIVDNAVDVTPRKIPFLIPAGGKIEQCTRPLRGDTQKGERVALATSEAAPAGSVIEFEVTTPSKVLDDLVVKCLDSGSRKGMGQWRNSGKGRFRWEKIG